MVSSFLLSVCLLSFVVLVLARPLQFDGDISMVTDVEVQAEDVLATSHFFSDVLGHSPAVTSFAGFVTK